jgi:hypothetical protein
VLKHVFRLPSSMLKDGAVFQRPKIVVWEGKRQAAGGAEPGDEGEDGRDIGPPSGHYTRLCPEVGAAAVPVARARRTSVASRGSATSFQGLQKGQAEAVVHLMVAAGEPTLDGQLLPGSVLHAKPPTVQLSQLTILIVSSQVVLTVRNGDSDMVAGRVQDVFRAVKARCVAALLLLACGPLGCGYGPIPVVVAVGAAEGETGGLIDLLVSPFSSCSICVLALLLVFLSTVAL